MDAPRPAAALNAAQFELERLEPPKLWLTARGLAARIRSRHPGLRSLSQQSLFEALAHHAEHERARVIRNSRSPSAKTLEVLWGAVSRVGEMEVEPPWRRAQTPEEELAALDRALNGAPAEEDADDPPDFFLSYNHNDHAAAAAVTEILEGKGHSVWMAGAVIAAGDMINDAVRSAMAEARGMLLYLSSDSLRSLWVAKEQLVGGLRELPRWIIARGDDVDLMDLIHHWLGGDDDTLRDPGDFGGLLQVDELSYNVAASFRDQLRDDIRDPLRPIYVFPAGDHLSDRFLPLSSFAVEPRPEP